MQLSSYFSSSAAYRVRLALHLKELPFSTLPVNLLEGEQRGDYLKGNPQGLVPAIRLEGGEVLSQSTAIIEWLEESYPRPPLLPRDPLARARIRALCQHIACDIHPLNNLRVLQYLRNELAQDPQTIQRWYAHWIRTGFIAIEPAVQAFSGDFSLGAAPGMLEVFLVPQLFNARKFDVNVDEFPAIVALDARCQEIDAFQQAHPLRQPDAPKA
jgi:maleylacetoacetate isomerase